MWKMISVFIISLIVACVCMFLLVRESAGDECISQEDVNLRELIESGSLDEVEAVFSKPSSKVNRRFGKLVIRDAECWVCIFYLVTENSTFISLVPRETLTINEGIKWLRTAGYEVKKGMFYESEEQFEFETDELKISLSTFVADRVDLVVVKKKGPPPKWYSEELRQAKEEGRTPGLSLKVVDLCALMSSRDILRESHIYYPEFPQYPIILRGRSVSENDVGDWATVTFLKFDDRNIGIFERGNTIKLDEALHWLSDCGYSIPEEILKESFQYEQKVLRCKINNASFEFLMEISARISKVKITMYYPSMNSCPETR